MRVVEEHPSVVRGYRLHSFARVIAILSAVLAVADLFRWGNRWYVSTLFTASGEEFYATHLLENAHAALVSALLWTLLCILAAGVGWRLRVVRLRD